MNFRKKYYVFAVCACESEQGQGLFEERSLVGGFEERSVGRGLFDERSRCRSVDQGLFEERRLEAKGFSEKGAWAARRGAGACWIWWGCSTKTFLFFPNQSGLDKHSADGTGPGRSKTSGIVLTTHQSTTGAAVPGPGAQQRNRTAGDGIAGAEGALDEPPGKE